MILNEQLHGSWRPGSPRQRWLDGVSQKKLTVHDSGGPDSVMPCCASKEKASFQNVRTTKKSYLHTYKYVIKKKSFYGFSGR